MRRQSSVPIVMLSAKREETDHVVGLQSARTTTFTKPFGSAGTPSSRARGVAPRRYAAPGARHAFGRLLKLARWTLDTPRRELTSPANVTVDLSAGECGLLLAFAEHPQRVLTRDQLLDLAKNRVSGGLDEA